MNSGPTLKSLIQEHWHLARRLRHMAIYFHPERCQGVWECYEVCPVGCWQPDYGRGVVTFVHADQCIACGACVLQCPEDAIELR